MNELIQLSTWAICLLGLTYIVTESVIFKGLRDPIAKKSEFLRRLMLCPICFSLWGGAILSLVYLSPTGNILTDAILGTGVYCILGKVATD